MRAEIALLPGDGIGREVVPWGEAVLEVVARRFQHTFTFTEGAIGGGAIDQTGTPLPDSTVVLCRRAAAVLLGAVGGPQWDKGLPEQRPEYGLLRLRKALGLYANLRPVKSFAPLADASPVKRELVAGTDLLIVRELTGGLYFGRPRGRRVTQRGFRVVDTLAYTQAEMERILRLAFTFARSRRRHLTSVDKANIMATSRLWREVAHEVATEYPDVQYEDVLVDAMSMHLIRRPRDFDVIAAENMFGDILSDEAAGLVGGLGVAPSANVGAGRVAVCEPVHGSAPDIAGRGIANPIGAILSAAMLLDHIGQPAAAERVRRATAAAVAAGVTTPDLGGTASTAEVTAEICRRVAS